MGFDGALTDLFIGRLGLPTIEDPVTESLGSEVSGVGDSSAVGQRRPKGFTLNFLVHGLDGALPKEIGNRMRRQLRSLMQNSMYRLAGVYMAFAADPERNGWLVIGEAQLSDNDGGVTFGSYKLSLSQAFLVASPRTHRDAYRLDLTDLRAATAWVDTLGQVVNTAADFAALPALAITPLPVGAHDLAVQNDPITAGARVGADGICPVCVARTAGDVVSWERAEGDFNKGDVVAYDRRGNTTVFPLS